MEKLQITSEGIKKNLNKIKPHIAICEYIWNGLDANANIIKINTKNNEFGGITEISISDNGNGINYNEIKKKFSPFNESEKGIGVSFKSKHSLPHGRNGVGRLTFFRFSDSVKWNTVYKDIDSINKKYYIKMSRATLNEYDINNDQIPGITDDSPGTTVIFYNVYDIIDEKQIIDVIKQEFFWLIWIYSERNLSIYINEDKIDFSELISESYNIDIANEDKLEHGYDIQVALWKEKKGQEYSRFYFFNSKGEEVYKKATTLNNKSDNFFHSVKIKSDYFDNFIFDTEIENQPGLISTENDAEYKKLITIITQSLIKKRKAYLKKASQIYIEKLINEKAYPCFNESNIIDSYKREQLDAIVEALYIAEPKLFASLNTSQKKVFIRLLNTIMSSDDKESLFKIVDEVVELEDDERKSFADLLSQTTLANIISTIKIIEDRTVSVQALKEIVFNKTWNAYEVQHVQKVMERHFWLIGEQYHLLTSAEPDFNEALRRLLDFKKENVQDAKINHEDANKEMDIFLVKQDKSLGYFKNIVVELKRPSIKLGEKELSQVKRYMRVIQSDDRFNSANSQWVYYLIGNKFDTTNYIEGEIKNNVNHGENGLVYNVGNHKIFVKKWSEVFEEWETRSQFLLDKLKFSKSVWMKEHTSADDAVNSIIDNSASIAPYKM